MVLTPHLTQQSVFEVLQMDIKRLICVLLFLSFLVHGQYIQPNLCNGKCYCSEADSVVDCSPQDKVQGVPTNLPSGTKKLFIQGGVFDSPGHLSAFNLTKLGHLISLRIVNSQLRSIDARAFLGMTNLRQLDLSLNNLQRLEPHTFYGLKLTNLYIHEQKPFIKHFPIYPFEMEQQSQEEMGLELADEVFYGLGAGQINLRNNRISKITFNLFSQVTGLEKLILSSNSIRKLDDKFAEYFDKPDRLIDLTDNPLVCSCNLAWLANRVKEWVTKMPSLNTTCLVDERPEKFKRSARVELRKLSTSHLCMASRIQSIGVEITPTGQAATLSCTAIAYNRMINSNRPTLDYTFFQSGASDGNFDNQPIVKIRPPSVAWKYIESGQLRQVTGMPSDFPQPADHLNKTMTTVQLNVSLSQIDRKFTCITWDDKKNDQEVLVTVRGPALLPLVEDKTKDNSMTDKELEEAQQLSPKVHETNQKGDQDSNEIALSHSNFLFQKKYTLLEMIGAIIGTLLSTLILLVIGSRCRRFLRGHTFCHSRAVADSKDPSNRPIVYDADMMKPVNSNIITRVNNNLLDTNYDHLPVSNAYPSYNPYAAQTASTVYPTFIPATSLVASPTYRQLGSTHMPINVATPLLQQTQIPGNLIVPGLQQPSTCWSPAPGSTYSVAGSHVYDVPRSMDASQTTCDSQQQVQQQQQQQQLTTQQPQAPHQQMHPATSTEVEFSGFGNSYN